MAEDKTRDYGDQNPGSSELAQVLQAVEALRGEFSEFRTKVERRLYDTGPLATELQQELREFREETGQKLASLETKNDSRIAALRDELTAGLASVRDELKAEIAAVRDELSARITAGHEELKAEIASVRKDLEAGITAVREELEEGFYNIEARQDALNDAILDRRTAFKILEKRVSRLEDPNLS